jgi:spermidine synthase
MYNNQSTMFHAHHKRLHAIISSNLRLLETNGSSRRHRRRKIRTIQLYEAMVHPSLLIHPNPQRILIIYDIYGHMLLEQVLRHQLVQEIIVIVPESFQNQSSTTASTAFLTDRNDVRVEWVYTNDPIPTLLHQQTSSMTLDVIFMDAETYVQYSCSLVMCSVVIV